MRIRAALAREVGRLTTEEVELDPPKETEVLVRMRVAGVCHSDLHVYRGELRVRPPIVLGHEGAGVVEAVGSQVGRVKRGDRVMVNWLPACEMCARCLNGRPNLCQRFADTTFKGMLLDGTSRLRTLDGIALKHMLGAAIMAEYAVVDEAGVISFPADVPFDVAAVTGCAVATGVGAVINTAQAKPGTPAAVIGCGGVGLSAIQGCRLAGCNPIVAIDVIDRKLVFAKRLGATHVVNPKTSNLEEALRDLTDGGPECIFDSVGSAATIPQALALTRPGGTTTVVGLHAARADVPILEVEVPISPAVLIYQNKRLLGSFAGSIRPRLDLPMLFELYRAGKLQLDELITGRYPLDDLARAFEDMESGKVARGVLVFGTE